MVIGEDFNDHNGECNRVDVEVMGRFGVNERNPGRTDGGAFVMNTYN